MNVLGLIPARGGSRRVKGKNLRLLGGHPLIGWTIEAAKMTHSLDRLVVSSEDPKILQVAHECGAEALVRPAEMATDEASSYPLMLHALDSLDEPFDYLCLLQPTSPFRRPIDIDNCIGAARQMDLAAVISVREKETAGNGAIYVGRTDWLRDRLAAGDAAPFDGPAPEFYPMARDCSLDIDTEEDFVRAEAMASFLMWDDALGEDMRK
ncbi:MAG TPA: acylneuraminate cytidylyltransferase family protein [Aurantimonas coralicida]|uniref:Acylneuraminate cytidylyltransferase family protein n=2 Tax=root TaxID=1 RepID=A0A9C9TFV8_9HYPH|nr:acylneuraminate cytidylyltransferase family protein [Aurantimonas coralicida]HET99656.1 acylneuraminate cytidylyltransferase family protein [Aurantimonas coralicida]